MHATVILYQWNVNPDCGCMLMNMAWMPPLVTITAGEERFGLMFVICVAYIIIANPDCGCTCMLTNALILAQLLVG